MGCRVDRVGGADPAAQRAAQLEAARHTIGEKVEQITAAKASAPFTLRNAPVLSPLLRGKAAPIGQRVDALAESLLGQQPPSHNASKRSIVKLKGAVRSVGQTARQRLKRTVSIPGATGVSEDKRAANLAGAMQDFASSEGMDKTPESTSGEQGHKTLSPSGLASTRKLRIAAMVVERLSQTHKDVHRRSIEKLRRKRSNRDNRARPWAEKESAKRKNINRLRRHVVGSQIMFDIEGLRAHIQATRQNVEAAEEYLRKHREEKSDTNTADEMTSAKKRPPMLGMPGLGISSQHVSPGLLRSPAFRNGCNSSPLVLQLARSRRLKFKETGHANSPYSPGKLKSPYSNASPKGGKHWGIVRSRFRLHDSIQSTLTPTSRKRSEFAGSPFTPKLTPGTCRSIKAGNLATLQDQIQKKAKTPLDHSPHPSQRYIPGIGQMWVFTKKGKVVKVIGREMPVDGSTTEAAAAVDKSGIERAQQYVSGVMHMPKALF